MNIFRFYYLFGIFIKKRCKNIVFCEKKRNFEGFAYGPTNCAERTAFFKAVYDGHREFTAIAVCGGKDGIITGGFPPCGVCRQVMREFCTDDFRIHMVNAEGFETHTLAELLPFSFSAGEHMQG